MAFWILLILQILCALFFLYDGLMDLFGPQGQGETRYSDRFEYVIAAVLGISVIFTGYQLRNILIRQKRMEDQLMVASGAFAELLDKHFEEWSLTPSERDVALLAIKGFSIADMAKLRDTREGTIKTQCNAIYRKANVSGRPQLLSLFIEELMADGLPDAQ
ncbi:MAG: LuxR family transcriptional regulator [Rhizobiaceae bacterium]